jgi:hypothetical protein
VLCVLEALMYSSPEMAAQAERDPRTHPEATGKMANAIRRRQRGKVRSSDDR